jgi:hypothetical protein
VCLVSLIRLAILIQAKVNTDPDFTFINTDLTYWTVIEVHTAIVVACTMTLKPLVAKFFPDLLGAGRSDVSSKSDEPSAANSSEPPLTIGSKPSRQLPVDLNGRRGGEVMLGDIEQQRYDERLERGVPAGEKSTGKDGGIQEIQRHSPWRGVMPARNGPKIWGAR